jgi:hypothetical protein
VQFSPSYNHACTAAAGDVPQNLASITVLAGYTQTITMEPNFAAGPSQALTVTGDVTVNGGAAGGGLVLSGLVETKTFAFENVDTGADTITIDSHGYVNGDVVQITTDTTMPGGLTSGLACYVGNVTANTFTLHATLTNAQAGTPKIDVTSQGAGTHTSTHGVGVTINCANFTVAADKVVHSDSRGFSTASGPASGINNHMGSGHGGRGGSNPKDTYGSVTAPVTLGSSNTETTTGFGVGGGAIKINCPTGTATINGTVRANSYGNDTYGGASGGSVYIICDTFAGAATGLLQANGGTTSRSDRFGGGGGRLAVVWNTSTYAGSYECAGGTAPAGGLANGVAGTLSLPEGTGLNLTVNKSIGLAPGSHTFGSVSVVSNATLVLHGDRVTGEGCSLQATSFTVENGCTVFADREGYRAAAGPGGGSSQTIGGTHGGRGGNVNPLAAYGAVAAPIGLGSGGGDDGSTASWGGGAIKIDVGVNSLAVNGVITADGWGSDQVAGGAGGSIWLICGTLSGNGTIRASGGTSSRDNWGSGGGGRIALQYATSTFAGTTSVAGGNGTSAGEAGSIIPANLTLADHVPLGQVTNQFNKSGTINDVRLCRWKFATGGNTDDAAFEDVRVTKLVFDLTDVSGIASGEVTGIEVWADTNNDGVPDAKLTSKAEPAPSCSIVGATGTITLEFDAGEFVVDASAGKSYVLVADVAGLAAGDKMTVRLNAVNDQDEPGLARITGTGVSFSKEAITDYPTCGFAVLSGSTTAVTHWMTGPMIGWVAGSPPEIEGGEEHDEGYDINWNLGTNAALCSTYNTLNPGTGNTYNMKLRNYGSVTVDVTAVVTVSAPVGNPWTHSATATPAEDTFALFYTLDENDVSWKELVVGDGGTKIIAGWVSWPTGTDKNLDFQFKTPTSLSGPSHAGAQVITVTLTASYPP